MTTTLNRNTGIIKYADVFDGIRVSFDTKVPVTEGVARNILVTKAQRIRASINARIADGKASAFRRHGGAFGVGRIRV